VALLIEFVGVEELIVSVGPKVIVVDVDGVEAGYRVMRSAIGLLRNR
jgi:hypothetical protein